ncbi:MAG: lysine--tRNA ligase [Candidatus Lokiarchaeota archaeon]
MIEEFPKHWLQDIVNEIKEKKPEKVTLATGKTPSGHIHIGILREILICDALRRIFEKETKDVRFILFLDSFDAAKRFPDYLNEEFKSKYLGKPFYSIPCPFEDCNCESYAYHFGSELASTFEDFGIKNEIIWSHELYKRKSMQKMIKKALENTEKIKGILKKYILPTLDEDMKQEFLEMQESWMPAMTICEKCKRILHKESDGSIIPNRVIGYDPKLEEVYYECPSCGNKGRISIYSGLVKLNWRVDWPAKWALFNTTCEPAGKDHCVKGGAYDSGLEICQEVYNYEGPIKVPYEWLRLGDKDMKTSKGIVFTPKKYLKMADPEIFRMLILRTNPMKHISFRIEELPQYYDYFERMEDIYYGDEVENDEEKETFEYLYPLIKVGDITKKKPQNISFNLLVFLSQLQNILSFEKLYEKVKQVETQKGFEEHISKGDFKLLLNRTENWVEEIKKILEKETNQKVKKSISRKISLFKIPEVMDTEVVKNLSEQQVKGIIILRNFLEHKDNLNEDLIQNEIFNIAKEKLDMAPKKLFQAIYLMLLGKKYGPRLGSFLVLLDREWLLNRLKID